MTHLTWPRGKPVEDRVAPGDGCSLCGEVRVDYLVISDESEDWVYCTTCDYTYRL